MRPDIHISNQIVDTWAEELAIRFLCTASAVRDDPARVITFPLETIRVVLVDASVVEFKYAFFVVSEVKGVIAVFTEHCGHHVFPYHDAKVFCSGALVYEQRDH